MPDANISIADIELTLRFLEALSELPSNWFFMTGKGASAFVQIFSRKAIVTPHRDSRIWQTFGYHHPDNICLPKMIEAYRLSVVSYRLALYAGRIHKSHPGSYLFGGKAKNLLLQITTHRKGECERGSYSIGDAASEIICEKNVPDFAAAHAFLCKLLTTIASHEIPRKKLCHSRRCDWLTPSHSHPLSGDGDVQHCLLKYNHKGEHLIHKPDNQLILWKLDENCGCSQSDERCECAVYREVSSEQACKILQLHGA